MRQAILGTAVMLDLAAAPVLAADEASTLEEHLKLARDASGAVGTSGKKP
jgi:hypothetical protein